MAYDSKIPSPESKGLQERMMNWGRILGLVGQQSWGKKLKNGGDESVV